ncbi:MAG: hydroxymethylglutaryl-CoA reductase, degradative [Roseiflexaceae bacterium]|jgi:hydroxymethylglutaryl-CoA reductase|nr:hydroxymethylglutaryl-CoA reductase, degradative [Chloroflexaceae bacterium]MCE2852691.1 hydroxymethylglutaryl-CoA reductase, degradative [Chloroflexaceae bacterium]
MKKQTTSRIEGFYRLDPVTRRMRLRDATSCDDATLAALAGGQLGMERADKMIENVVGTYELPVGVATNFQINGRDRLVPMVVEEPSIVAGASYAARMARESGGFVASHTEPIMIGQIQLIDVTDVAHAMAAIHAARLRLIECANAQSQSMVARGGGARDIEMHHYAESPMGAMLIVHLLVDCRDAMGANAINSMCEAVAPILEELSGGRAMLRILSNLTDRRLASARVRIAPRSLERDGIAGADVVERILWAYAFAAVDPYRATTHNKGIMNGIDPVIVATSNDWRAIEAGAHAWAARSGRYTSLSHWYRDNDGYLCGELTMPLAVGIVGGATRVHPSAQAALQLLDVQHAGELAEVCVCAGLASNLAAMRALATEGIQRGHMALHARQIAMAAGAEGDEVVLVAERMIAQKSIKPATANAIIAELRAELA